MSDHEQDFAAVGATTDEHQRLAAFAGTFRAEVSMWMGPDLDGRFLKQTDESGRVWTMTGEMPNPATGDRMTKRSVITVEDDDHHRIEMFFDTGAGEAKAMEIRYTRA